MKKTKDTDYHVNLGRPWDREKKPARIDEQSGYCWIVDERGYVVFSFQLPESNRDNYRGHPHNLIHAKKFFARYFKGGKLVIPRTP